MRGWKELLTTVPPVGRTGDLLVLPGVLWDVRRWRRLSARTGAIVDDRSRTSRGGRDGARDPLRYSRAGLDPAARRPDGARTHHLGGRPEPSRASRASTPGGPGLADWLRRACCWRLLCSPGLAVGGSLPFAQARDRVIWRDTFEPPFDPSIYPSPLGYYREYVKQLDDAPLFTVTGLPDGVPRFGWRRSTSTTGSSGRSPAARAPDGIGRLLRTRRDRCRPDYGDATTTTVDIEFPDDSAYDEVWLPTVGEAQLDQTSLLPGASSATLADGYRYNRTTDTAAVLGEPQPGDSYELTVAVPAHSTTWNLMRPSARSRWRRSLGSLAPSAASVAAPSRTSTDSNASKRSSITSEMTGYYSDSNEEDGQAPVPAGHGFGRLQQFADASELVGNAEQYAATLGLILRNSGIPARVVMGFIPKEYDPTGTVTITGTDAEAWVEVLVDDVGWVPVYPTPERTKTTIVQDDTPKPIPDRETQVPPPPPVIEPDAEVDPASESTQTERERKEEPDTPEENSGGLPVLLIAAVGVVLLPVLLISAVVGTILLMKRRRRRRRRGAGRGDERVANGWKELVDYAVDTGRPVPTATTRREAAAVVGVETAPYLAAAGGCGGVRAGRPLR